MEDAIRADSISLAEAAARYDISPQTLRRLCDTKQLSCERDARGWRVQPREVEGYLLARRPAGRQNVGLWLQGPAPNPRLRAGVGWLFKAAGRGGQQIFITIWFSEELVAALQRDDHDVRDLVTRAAERLVADALLDTDDLTSGQEILYGSADRSFILRAAGIGDDTYLAGEAPAEAGVSVLYELTARDFSQDGLWPGDSIDVADTGYEDVVVDTRSEGAVHRVRAVRVPMSEVTGTRAQAIERALREYEARCRGLGRPLGPWVVQVAARADALTLAQQRVLDLVYDAWRETDQWPSHTYIEGRLEHEYDLDLGDVLATFPAGLLWGLSPHSSRSDKLQLTVAGLSHCGSAGADTDLFVAVLGYLVRRRREFLPSSPTEDEHVCVASSEVRENVPLAADSPSRSVERLYDLFMQDPYAHQGGGKTADGSWTIYVGPEIRRYRGVQTVGDYLARRQPAATVEAQAPPPPPRHVGAITTLAAIVPEAAGVHEPNPGGIGVPADESDVFVLMPFAAEFDVVWQAIGQASSELGLRCIRADSITEPGRITQQIVEGMRAAKVIIADVTGNNPNVMFELGYADALAKPIIVLNQRVAEAPFDLRDWRQIEYSTASLAEMRDTLASFLSTTLVKPGAAGSS